MKYVLLEELDYRHPFRHQGLHSLGAEESTQGKPWRKIGSHWGIAKACFADLGRAWTDHGSFRIPVSDATFALCHEEAP